MNDIDAKKNAIDWVQWVTSSHTNFQLNTSFRYVVVKTPQNCASINVLLFYKLINPVEATGDFFPFTLSDELCVFLEYRML